VPEVDIDSAMTRVWQMIPSPSAARSGAAPATGFQEPKFRSSEEEGPGFRSEQFGGMYPAPFDSLGLNRLLIHPRVVEFVRLALDEHDVRLYQSILWAKFAGAANYEQPHHKDQNHSLIPTRPEPGWWHLEGFLYLSDVTDDTAPPLVAKSDNSLGASRFPNDDPGLYEIEKPMTGPRGTFLAYRNDVWHRGSDFVDPEAYRVVITMCFKLPGHEWIQYNPPQQNSLNLNFVQFLATLTPDELAIFGVPRPGHAFWTANTVAAMSERYPGLDVAPWRDAIG